jgi:hypothetical protein
MTGHHNPPAHRPILEDVFSALTSGEDSSWQLQRASNGAIVLLVPRTGTRYLMRVEEHPLARFNPDTGTITCPQCGATSDNGEIEHWEDEVARRRLHEVRGTTALFDLDVDRFDDDGSDARLGCTHCGGAADFPDNLASDWSEPGRGEPDEQPHGDGDYSNVQ